MDIFIATFLSSLYLQDIVWWRYPIPLEGERLETADNSMSYHSVCWLEVWL